MPSYLNRNGKHQLLHDKYVPRMVPKNKKAVPKSCHEELLRVATNVYSAASLNTNYTWANLVTYGVVSAAYKAPKDAAKTVQKFFSERPELTPKRLERMLDLVLKYVDAKEVVPTRTGGTFDWERDSTLLIIPFDTLSAPNPTFEDRIAHQSITDNDSRLTRSYPINLTSGEIVLYRLPRATLYNKKQYISQYNPILWQALSKGQFLCKSEVSGAFIDDSVANNEFLMVAYGIVNGSKIPIGFATLHTLYNRRLEYDYPVLRNNRYPSRQGNSAVNVLYIDLICAPFSTSGIGSLMIKALETYDVRNAIKNEMGDMYDSIALRAIDDVYTYYPMVHGYVRTNGDGNVYPFGVIEDWLFYDKNDVAAVPREHKKKLIEVLSSYRPKLFKKDSQNHGYLFMKRV